MRSRECEYGSAHQQVNHCQIEASQVPENNAIGKGNPSGDVAPPLDGRATNGVSVGWPGIILPVSDPFRHLEPGMFTANLAQGLDRAGFQPVVLHFSRVLNGRSKPHGLVCVPPQAGSANADILKVLAARPPRSVFLAPGKHQGELLDDKLLAIPPRVCVLSQRRLEEVADCRGDRAMERISRRMPGICLVSFALGGVVAVDALGERVNLPGYDLPVVNPESADEAFVAGLVASLTCCQGLVRAAAVGLAQMACVAAAGQMAGFMTWSQAAKFIREHAQARRCCSQTTRLLKLFGL